MNIQEARNSIGKMVMSRDRKSNKLLRVDEEHGPYRLLAITKDGMAILEGLEEFRAAPSKIRLAAED